MMAFFDFIFPSKTLNKSDCESQVVSDLNSNTMNENNIEQEKTTDSAKNNSVEDLELPFQSLFSNEDEKNNSIKTSTPAKNQNGSANKSARRKSNRRRQNNKFMNSMSSETASEISINTDNSSNLDLSQVVTSTPQNTVSKNQMKREHFVKNRNKKNFKGPQLPSIFDPIEEQFFQVVTEKTFNFASFYNKYDKFNPKKMQQQQDKSQNSSQKDDFFKKRNQSLNLKNQPTSNQFNPHFNKNHPNSNYDSNKSRPTFSQQSYPTALNIPSLMNANYLYSNHFVDRFNYHTHTPNFNQSKFAKDSKVNQKFMNSKFVSLNNQSGLTQNALKTENEKNFKKFVKITKRKNQNSENSIVSSDDTSLESKEYATNQFHYRNPNWKKNSKTTNTTTTTTTDTDSAIIRNSSVVVDDIFQKANRAMRARRLMAHNVVNDMDDALNVVRLMSDEELTEEEAVFQVTGYTKKVQCPICCLSFERNEIETMLSCNHECCTSCAKNHFTEQIRNKSLKFCVCFACDEPKWLSCDIAVSSEKVTDYFGMMDIVLRRLLDTDVHDIFQNKLRDFSLAKEDNFKWCSNCSFGYFIDKTSEVKFVICENCEFVSCINCSLEWKSQHEKIDCEQFKQWLEDNDENLHKNTVKKYIEQNGIVCPKCKFQYILSRGGCMHFTCNQCKHEFCNGCNNPFYRDASKCQTSYCKSLGLHAHHPKNCYFYLRDKEPADLKRLLLNNKIDFLSVCEDVKKCPIPLQKEDNGVLYDEICNEDVVSTNQAGFCQKHYVEYLAKVIRENDIDTLEILTIEDLENIVLRSGKRLPPYVYGTPKDLYRKLLIEKTLHRVFGSTDFQEQYRL